MVTCGITFKLVGRFAALAFMTNSDQQSCVLDFGVQGQVLRQNSRLWTKSVACQSSTVITCMMSA